MGVYLADQTMDFFSACLIGAALGLFYDCFRILRVAFPAGRGAIFVQDVLFWAVCAVTSFLFLLTSIDGVVRVFLLAGELLGGVVYHCAASEWVMRAARVVIGAVKAILRFFYRFLILPIWRLVSTIAAFFLRPVRYLWRFVKKYLQRCKFRLKVQALVLYNYNRKCFSKRKCVERHEESLTYEGEKEE